MRVHIESEDGATFLRAFRNSPGIDAYAIPEAIPPYEPGEPWPSVDVPEDLVVAYNQARATLSALTFTLSLLEEHQA